MPQLGVYTSTVLATGTQTASTSSPAVTVGEHSDVVAYLNVTAASGTTPSLTVTLQDSPDGVTWYDVPSGAFPAATAVGTARLGVTGVGPYLRAVSTVSGTTPSFTFDVQAAATN